MTSQASIIKTEWPYFQKLLSYHGLEYYPTSENPNQWSGNQQKIKGFDQYNFLLDINLVFSTRPSGDVRDRTLQTPMPFQLHAKPWTRPDNQPESFEYCLNTRVKELTAQGQKINLLWSGGIDSTAMVVAFLQQTANLDQLRIIHSVISRKENPFFFLLLQQYPQVEVIEMGGDYYMQNVLDGLVVEAGQGDNLLASLDDSFWNQLNANKGQQPWKDYFFRRNSSVNFINQCEEFFARSGRSIDTILEARWWFYMICKFSISWKPSLLQDEGQLVTSFFDSKLFEDYLYYNTDLIVPTTDYKSYKQFMKDYIFEFDKNRYYNLYKCKENSGQLTVFAKKKNILKNIQPIMWLSDGSRVGVDTLPFLSEGHYRQKYGNTLDYLFAPA